MNDAEKITCGCESCPGASCGCGCQSAVAQDACACGPQCGCGSACKCADAG